MRARVVDIDADNGTAIVTLKPRLVGLPGAEAFSSEEQEEWNKAGEPVEALAAAVSFAGSYLAALVLLARNRKTVKSL